jgi:hypothetical protein
MDIMSETHPLSSPPAAPIARRHASAVTPVSTSGYQAGASTAPTSATLSHINPASRRSHTKDTFLPPAPSPPLASPSSDAAGKAATPPPGGAGVRSHALAALMPKWNGAKRELVALWKAMSTKPAADIFKCPVTEDEAPGYSATIRYPMDLATIKSLIESGDISTVDELQKATWLMLDNCVLYNGKGSQYADRTDIVRSYMAPKFEEVAAREPPLEGSRPFPAFLPPLTPSHAASGGPTPGPKAGTKRKREAADVDSLDGDSVDTSQGQGHAPKRSQRRVSAGPDILNAPDVLDMPLDDLDGKGKRKSLSITASVKKKGK